MGIAIPHSVPSQGHEIGRARATYQAVLPYIQEPARTYVETYVGWLERDVTEEHHRYERTMTDRLGAEPVTGRMLDDRTGYLDVANLFNGAGSEARDAVAALVASGATRFVVDVRDNPGGTAEDTTLLAGLFLPKGADVLHTSGALARDWKAVGGHVDPAAPLAVLVTRGTGCGAEAFAAAIAEHRRGPVIGETTSGKNWVREDYRKNHSFRKVGSWRTALGRDIGPAGLTPTIHVKDHRDGTRDDVLQRAIEYLDAH